MTTSIYSGIPSAGCIWGPGQPIQRDLAEGSQSGYKLTHAKLRQLLEQLPDLPMLIARALSRKHHTLKDREFKVLEKALRQSCSCYLTAFYVDPAPVLVLRGYMHEKGVVILPAEKQFPSHDLFMSASELARKNRLKRRLMLQRKLAARVEAVK